jgi:GTP-binding nuclear protein Ran
VAPISVVYEDGSEGIFIVWDCAGQEKFGGLGDGYYVGADAFVVMCDATSRLTMESVENLVKGVKRVCGENIPIIYVLNKIDVPNQKTMDDERYPFIRISVKNSTNLYAPLEALSHKKIASIHQLANE